MCIYRYVSIYVYRCLYIDICMYIYMNAILIFMRNAME